MCSHRDHHQCSTVTDVAQPMYYNQRTVTDIVLSPIQYRPHVVQPMYRHRYRTITDTVSSPISYYHRYSTVTDIELSSTQYRPHIVQPMYRHRYRTITDTVSSPMKCCHRSMYITNVLSSLYHLPDGSDAPATQITHARLRRERSMYITTQWRGLRPAALKRSGH